VTDATQAALPEQATDSHHMAEADQVTDYVRRHQDTFLADLIEWLRIPSIGTDPEHTADVRRSAEWLVDRLRAVGFPTVEVWETAGHPAVFAEWPADDATAPTVVVYGPHDVQPVDPLELWETAPFEPLRRGDELVARGAIDDKGQVLFHLLGLQAHLAAGGRTVPAVHLKVLVEGEEESGSPHFPALLHEHRHRLRCDAVVVSDTGVFNRDTPSICTGMRGLTDGQINLYGPAGDLHSGSFGGAVPNPLHALAALLAGLHDDAGRVTVPGFYDSVVPLSDRERELFARLPFDEQEWMSGPAQSSGLTGEAGFSTLERIWARPTAEVNGMWGGYTGPGQKTIIPSSAHAKVSFRLVAGQQPEQVQVALTAYVQGAVPAGIRAEVEFDGPGVRPCLTPLDAPALQAVVRAMQRAFGTEVLFTREGGSGPEADLAEVLGAPVLFLGVGLPDDRIHAPNERVVVPMLLTGARAAAYLWDELAALPRT
jgi:acetylornithine deacetylase/succinyl-diaminopimelate desuccinylase-like protein